MAEEISERARARKAAFVAAKEAAGGAVEYLRQQEEKAYRLYFDEDGNIVSLHTEGEVTPEDSWETYDFTPEQLKILTKRDKIANLRNFKVIRDDDGTCHIEAQVQGIRWESAEIDFLVQVDKKKRAAELIITVDKDQLILKLGKKTKEKLSKIQPAVSATVNGERIIRIYLTAKDDPHTLYHKELISLAELIVEKEVVRDLPMHCNHLSVYTKKAFDKYSRE